MSCKQLFNIPSRMPYIGRFLPCFLVTIFFALLLVAQPAGGQSDPPAPIPDKPTGVTGFALNGKIVLEWDLIPLKIQADSLSHVEIWRAGPIVPAAGEEESFDFDLYPPLAIKDTEGRVHIDWVNPAETRPLPDFFLVGVSSFFGYTDTVLPDAYYIYWLRFIGYDNRPTGFSSINGFKIKSLSDLANLLRIFREQITFNQLDSVLTGAIPSPGAFDRLKKEALENTILDGIHDLASIAKFTADDILSGERVRTESLEGAAF